MFLPNDVQGLVTRMHHKQSTQYHFSNRIIKSHIQKISNLNRKNNENTRYFTLIHPAENNEMFEGK